MKLFDKSWSYKTESRKKVCNFFSLSNLLAFRLRMARRVSKINSMLDNIYKEANEIILKPVEDINTCVELGEIFRQTHPFVDDSEVVGRGGDVSKLVDMLVCSDGKKKKSTTSHFHCGNGGA